MKSKKSTDKNTFFENYSNKGVSTGCLGKDRNDWPRMIEISTHFFSSVIELSALSEDELPGLVDFVSSPAYKKLSFKFISVHAPTKNLSINEKSRVKIISRLVPYVDRIVFHPDTIKEPRLYQSLGNKIAIENMDSRKKYGQSVEDLAEIFYQIPEAMFCFDLAHAKTVDQSLELGWGLVERFADRTSHLHLSSINSSKSHIPITDEDIVLFSPFFKRFNNLPWILEDFNFDAVASSS